MPEIVRFGNCKICMYGGDHNPPHVHILSPDYHVRVEINSVTPMDGGATKRQISEALGYITKNKAALALRWIELNEQE